jgi:serine/threonine protein kinase
MTHTLPVLTAAGINEKIDIYSLAMVLYECATGHRPWEGLSNYAVIYKVRRMAGAAEPGTALGAYRFIVTSAQLRS